MEDFDFGDLTPEEVIANLKRVEQNEKQKIERLEAQRSQLLDAVYEALTKADDGTYAIVLKTYNQIEGDYNTAVTSLRFARYLRHTIEQRLGGSQEGRAL